MSNIVEQINLELKEAYKSKIAAANQAQSLKIISSDIYTEAERFIFELIQNAVDSFTDTSENVLDIHIELKEGYLVFMHNGKAFSERDVEGICGIGNGSKADDVKKIGYKGIGFKSVFVHSNDVVISSGEHCFRFAESEWDTSEHLMPWQIMPIQSQPPLMIECSDKYNVTTYIKLKNPESIFDTIVTLLSDSQFLLFLQCKNATIAFTSEKENIVLKKSSEEDIIELTRDNITESRWLTYHIDESDAIIPDDIKSKILLDEKTPNKIKESKYFDLSFAIRLSTDGEIEKVSSDEAVYFSYLPTSMKSGFNFLVNANLITDAGRQQIHKECEWNKFIISKIPYVFLKWMSLISRQYKDFYRILPEFKNTTDKLDIFFDESLRSALSEIAFLPSNQNEEVLKPSDAFIDRIEISGQYGLDVLVDHINRTYNKSFSGGGLIENKRIGLLKEYGVFVFDASMLNKFISDEKVKATPSSDFCVQIIKFLYKQINSIHDQADKETILYQLSKTNIIYSSEGKMVAPSECFIANTNITLISDVQTVNKTVINSLSSELVSWLKTLGVKKLTPQIYINDVLSKLEVTASNALKIGRFVFEHYSRGEVTLDTIKGCGLKFLTTRGSIHTLDELYLSSFYGPEIDIEPFVDSDIFVTSEYVNISEDVS